MEKIYHDLSLDFCETHTLKIIKVKQFDKDGRKIRLHLYNNGKEVTINSDTDTVTCYASINGVATAVGDTCEIENNAVIVHVGLPMTSIPGTEKCEIRVESGNGIVHTATFNIIVEPATVTADTPLIISTADIFDRLKKSDKERYEFTRDYTVALRPDYTLIEKNAKRGVMAITVPDYSDGDTLIVWIDYRIAEQNVDYTFDGAVINFITSATTAVNVQIWKIPDSGGGSAGQTVILAAGTSDSIAGIATKINAEGEL